MKLRRLTFLLFVATSFAQLSQGPNGPGTTTGAWANPSYALALDGRYASNSIPANANSLSFLLRSYGFTVPTGAAVQGIVVTVYRSDLTGFGDLTDRTIQLTSGGSPIGSNKALTATLWPPGASSQAYGSPTDVWGLSSPTGATVDDASFGLTVVVHNQNTDAAETAGLDFVSITVYYRAGGAHSYGAIVGQTRVGPLRIVAGSASSASRPLALSIPMSDAEAPRREALP